jgi:hypothetical protein
MTHSTPHSTIVTPAHAGVRAGVTSAVGFDMDPGLRRDDDVLMKIKEPYHGNK